MESIPISDTNSFVCKCTLLYEGGSDQGGCGVFNQARKDWNKTTYFGTEGAKTFKRYRIFNKKTSFSTNMEFFDNLDIMITKYSKTCEIL